MIDTASPDQTTVGWIGTGTMGRPMCGHLLNAGYRVRVYARRPSTADELVAAGAVRVASPAEAAAESDVVVSIVSHPVDVRSVMLGPDGALSTARPGTVLIDMSTSQPGLAREIYAAAAERDVASIDAPVSGGDVGAQEGRLSIMVGGDRAAVATVTPLLSVFGSTIVHQGGAGAGQHTKLVNQILIAGTMVSLCEGLLYTARAGLNPEDVLRSVSSGAAGSSSLTNLAPKMLAGDYEPGFLVEHFVKDLGIALSEARSLDLALPGLALADQLYRAVLAQGRGRTGTQALILALAELSAVRWPPDSAS